MWIFESDFKEMEIEFIFFWEFILVFFYDLNRKKSEIWNAHIYGKLCLYFNVDGYQNENILFKIWSEMMKTRYKKPEYKWIITSGCWSKKTIKQKYFVQFSNAELDFNLTSSVTTMHTNAVLSHFLFK